MKHHNADIIAIVLTASVLISMVKGLPDLLVLQPAEPWQLLCCHLFTCHLVHWTFEHLFYDALCFAIMVSVLPRKQVLVALFCFSPAVALAVLAFNPELPAYGGLSGIGYGLCVLLAWHIFRSRKKLALFSIAAITLKVIVEHSCNHFFFASSGFIPVHTAHYAGILSALFLIACLEIHRHNFHLFKEIHHEKDLCHPRFTLRNCPLCRNV